MDATFNCRRCNINKPACEFEHQKDRPNHRTTCKQCRYLDRDKEKEAVRHRVYSKERRITDPVVVRKTWERSVYGVCKEDLGEQKCSICGSTHKLCIDHCHTTGKVRGLLCSSCNMGIGHFGDSIEKLFSAISYLKDGPHFQLPFQEYP